MILFIIRFLDLLLSGLLLGIMIIIWSTFYHQNRTYAAYLETQQVALEAYRKIIPILAVVTILLTLSSAIFQNNIASIYLIISSILLFGAGIITRKSIQPLNKQIMR